MAAPTRYWSTRLGATLGLFEEVYYGHRLAGGGCVRVRSGAGRWRFQERRATGGLAMKTRSATAAHPAVSRCSFALCRVRAGARYRVQERAGESLNGTSGLRGACAAARSRGARGRSPDRRAGRLGRGNRSLRTLPGPSRGRRGGLVLIPGSPSIPTVVDLRRRDFDTPAEYWKAVRDSISETADPSAGPRPKRNGSRPRTG